MNDIKKQITLIVISIVSIIAAFILEIVGVEKLIYVVLYGVGFLAGGFYTFIEAVIHIKEEKSLSVDFLMIIAAIGAFIIGEYREGAILIIIFGLAHVLEEYAILKSEKTFTSLLKIAPDEAVLVKEDGKEVIVSVEDLKIGEVIKVKVGDEVAADGTIIEGYTAINEETITGEFLPREKGVNDSVYAGTINVTSTILVRVDKDPKETVAQNIINFVKTAQESKTAKESWVSKFEKWYVYVVILLALFVMFVIPLTGIWEQSVALYKGIIILVVASPCALVASITPAILSSLSNGAKQGILIKGGTPLEKAEKINTVVFDKTGTITEGIPEVVGYSIYDIKEEEFLKAVVSIEKESNHPLARAIVNHFKDVESVSVTTEEKAGIGIEGKIEEDVFLVGRFLMAACEECIKKSELAIKDGFTVVNVAKNNKMVGFIKLRDTIREDAYKAIKHLNKNNISTHMLTGDNEQIAHNVVRELNISSFASELMPEEKVDELEKLKSKNNQVMMIGDGINDAPALAASDISVAMGSATDVSLEVADMVFVNNELDSVNKVIYLSKRMNRIILQNIIFSIVMILILLTANLFTFMPISIGVIGHEGSTILVILNSLRLLLVKKEKER